MGLLKCPDCGKEFSDRIDACPNCSCPKSAILEELETKKEPIVEEQPQTDSKHLSLSEEGAKTSNNNKMNRQLGTKWFTFYTKVRPCLACLMCLVTIGDFIQYKDIYMNNWWLLLFFATAIVGPVLGIVVAVKSEGDYVNFVHFVKGVLLFETISTSYQVAVKQYLTSNLDIGVALLSFVIALLISYFVWYRLNIKYFRKRILLTPENSQQEDTEKVGTLYCRVCGSILAKDAIYCKECGTKITTATSRLVK